MIAVNPELKQLIDNPPVKPISSDRAGNTSNTAGNRGALKNLNQKIIAGIHNHIHEAILGASGSDGKPLDMQALTQELMKRYALQAEYQIELQELAQRMLEEHKLRASDSMKQMAVA